MENKPKIAVIMSTYNGEKYLKVQIDSILAQKDVDVSLYIFDDCSKDNTVSIAKEYEQKFNNVHIQVNEKNKNFTYNFLDALFSFKDNQEYDYYAFADQDDYWLEDKLITGIKQIEQKGKCTLYCSNLKVVDGNLNYSGINMFKTNFKIKRHDELCGNLVTGCTIIMDKEFKNLATKHYPENIYCHDYWLGILANYCKDANFIRDNCPDHILYRQHGNNQVGANKNSFFKKVYILVFKKFDKTKSVANLMSNFNNLYADQIRDNDKKVFKILANTHKLKNRLWLFFNIKTTFWRSFKTKIIFNRY